MEEYGLTQQVNVPTHTQGISCNIIDIVFTNRPDHLTKKLSVDDGVADYNTIFMYINISTKRKCHHKRKNCIKNKADNASILNHLDNIEDEYFMLIHNMAVNDKWNILTSKVTHIINKYIPHLFTSSRHNLPWITNNYMKNPKCGCQGGNIIIYHSYLLCATGNRSWAVTFPSLHKRPTRQPIYKCKALCRWIYFIYTYQNTKWLFLTPELST